MHGEPVPAPRRRPAQQCSLKLEDLLRTMAAEGALYPDAVELLQQAHRCDCLSCKVRSDALPQAVTVFDLAKAGKNGENLLNPDGEVVAAPQDLGSRRRCSATSSSRRVRGRCVGGRGGGKPPPGRPLPTTSTVSLRRGHMLKRLELVGFKSFADKTEFDSPRRDRRGRAERLGSNVVDAVRWVLGEQMPRACAAAR